MKAKFLAQTSACMAVSISQGGEYRRRNVYTVAVCFVGIKVESVFLSFLRQFLALLIIVVFGLLSQWNKQGLF